ncbi:MAG: MBL fold metallo-hydrolase [Betaproteobacteria bacterium]|jgi:hydroxyacylglutathione hydrolase|nr:MBL fold metallo-hydrolase [Betaproteobacteria bacterium]
MRGIVRQSNGIYIVDSGYSGQPRVAAVYFVVDHGRVAIIDTGSNASVPHILSALACLDIAPEAVEWVIPTHLHLDHAGGVGSLMCALPRAHAVIHPSAVSHLAHPARLWEKTIKALGSEQSFRLYGRLTPVDEGRIIPSQDGMALPLGDRILKLLDAPGHARHHIVVWDEIANAFFTGDAFGISYREFDVSKRSFIFPSSSPPQFDPVSMAESIARMLAYNPQAMYLAHYGKVMGVERLANDLFRMIHAQIAIAQAARGKGLARHTEILSGLEELVREESARQQWALNEEISLNLLRPDLYLNAQGLEIWLDRLHEQRVVKNTAKGNEAEMEIQAVAA